MASLALGKLRMELNQSHPRQSPGYSFLSKKILGGPIFLSMFFVEVCLRLQKNLGSRNFIGRNIVLKPFPCEQAFLHIFYIGIYWKTAKIAYFRYYEPLNVVFGVNFIPQPKGPNTRDILSKFWNVKMLVPWTLGLLKGSKWSFLVLTSYPSPKD